MACFVKNKLYYVDMCSSLKVVVDCLEKLSSDTDRDLFFLSLILISF